MESVDLREIVSALRRARVASGDVVNVHSRLHAVGRVRGVKSGRDIPATYVRAIREVVEDGTIVVPTYTTEFARYGRSFVLEETPSESGVLSEYVRQSEGARRILHPVVSLTAQGGRAGELADDHPRWNVGHDTIWDRMLRRSGKVVTVGISPWRSMSFMHQVEFLACVPYLYHKVLRGEVYAGGRRVEHDFFMAVRYLEYGIAYDLSRLESQLEERRAVRCVALGGSAMWVVPMEAAFDVGMRGLRRDPYYLLRRAPSFVEGRIPCDGITITREQSAPRYFLV